MTDFATLYQRYSPDVYRFALSLSGNTAHAEDIASETFARAWLSPTELRQGTVKAYLLTIARHLFLKGLRRDARHVELDDRVPDSSPGPAATAENRAELAEVLRALQRLPEVDRAALLLRAEEGLSYEEIAVALGLSLAAVKVKIHRARLRLAQSRTSSNFPP
jgi:RNA polymerase sigma-70 factor (ECF subfamily)